ncbi:MAG: DUF427 domain-containing protein [Bacteroidota bacterium]
MPPVSPVPPGPGQESVWDYPRPPRLEPVPEAVRIDFGGRTIARTERALRILETSHPPTVYLPPDAFEAGVLVPRPETSGCEWKGRAVYYDVVSGEARAEKAGWGYPDPRPPFEALTDHVAVYAGPMDACWIGDERVEPQPGGFYGGWITSRVVGPFKGAPGTWGW